MKKIIGLVTVLLIAGSLYAQEDIKTYIENLSDGSYEKKIEACRVLGQQKKTPLAIEPLAEVLLDDTNQEKIILLREAISALGFIGTQKSTIILSKFVQTTQNTDLIYASLISMLNISRIEGAVDSSTKEAFLYVNKNIKNDPLINNLLEKVKKKLNI